MTDLSAAPTDHSAPSPILFGPYGLRAGWSLLIALVLFFVFFLCTGFLMTSTHLVPKQAMMHEPGPLPVFLTEISSFLCVALVTWIMAKIERRPIGIYGLGGTHKFSRLILGAALGFVAISLLIFVLIKSGLLVIDRRLLTGSDAMRYAVLWIPGFLAIGLFEEYFFRGYLQYTLARGFSGFARFLPGSPDPRTVGFWTAAVLVSFGFGAVHGSNPGESPIGLFCAGLASLVFCFSLWRTGSLWWAVGLHTAWDYGQSFVYGVGDSGMFFGHRLLQTHPVGSAILAGGTTGPEGSVFSLVVLSLIAVVIHFTQRPGPTSYASKMPAPLPPPLEPDNSAELPATTS